MARRPPMTHENERSPAIEGRMSGVAHSEGDKTTELTAPGADAFRREVRSWLSDKLPSAWIDYASDSNKIQAASRYDGLTEGSWKTGSGTVHKGWDEVQASAGLLCPTWPRDYGGRGLGQVEEFILYDEYATAHAPDGFEVQGRYDVGPLILAVGTEEQKKRFLPQISAAQSIWCGGLSEPTTGSDLASLQTRAEPAEGGFRIFGEKIWTGFASIADHCLLLTRSSDGPRYHNLTYLTVDMHQPEITVTPLLQATGTHGFNHVKFDGALAREGDVLGEVDGGWQVAVGALGRERGATSALRRLVVMRETADQLLSCASSHTDGDPHDAGPRDRAAARRLERVVAAAHEGGPADQLHQARALLDHALPAVAARHHLRRDHSDPAECHRRTNAHTSSMSVATVIGRAPTEAGT
jgi:alkylation response protein AidB-like acyl-CoA dehydrogenase